MRILSYTLLTSMILVITCSSYRNDELQQILNESVYVKIYSYSDQGNKRLKTLIYSAEDSLEILKFKGYISNEDAPFYKCGYDGIIEFQTFDGKKTEMEFNLTTECRHIVYSFENKLYSKKLTENGYRFLSSLLK